MKKLLTILLLALLLTGCTLNNSPTINNNIEGADFLSVTPDPKKMCDNTINVYDDLSGQHYGFYVLDCDKVFYDKYINECANTTFVNERYTINSGAAYGNIYRATTAGEHYDIEVIYNAPAKNIMVTVTRN